MPSQSAERRERAAVEQVVQAMRASAPPDLAISIVGWPDDERGEWPETLTVEAVIELSDSDRSELWAADVVSLTWQRNLEPAVDPVIEWLRAELTKLALQYGRGITVSFRPPIGERDRGESYAAAIRDRVHNLLAGKPGQDPFVNDPDTYIELADGPLSPGGKPVLLAHSLAADTATAAQLEHEFVPAVEKKLRKQLRRAHEGGYHAMLIVDGAGHPGLFGGGNWLVGPATVSQVLGDCIAPVGHAEGVHVLDFAAMALVDGSCSPLFGCWPQQPSR